MRKVAKREVVKRVRFQGLDLAIEFVKGGQRPYRDDAGKLRFKTMRADYGEVEGTEGMDGDAVDVYVGPDKESDRVYVITQMTKGDWRKVDEEKVILGTSSLAEAKRLYTAHYDDPRFLGAVKEMSMDSFIERLRTRGAVGKKLASASGRIAELNYLRHSQGEQVLVGQAHGVKTAREISKDWDVEIPPEVKRKLKRENPSSLVERALYATGETELTKMEQAGIGVPASRIKGDPTDSKMRKAAAMLRAERFVKEAAFEDRDLSVGNIARRAAQNGAMVGGILGGLAIVENKRPTEIATQALKGLSAGAGVTIGGLGTAALLQRAFPERGRGKTKKAAKTNDRVGRIADRVDDVGIGMLAAPYAAKGLAGSLEHRGGRLGAIGAGARRAADAMHKHETKLELGGLALVAPGIGHRVAKGIDKTLPGQKRAGVGNVAGNLVKGTVGLGVGAAAAGVGAGAVGAKKLLKSHPHEGLSTVGYQAPRLF